ncbi:MAG: bifunctional oligoribonuclease/PAP phosphatase NrnA [Lachnospiraceae bacterium]|nr:bifunctional oligoribonuclease/PAP phosphatase NrnA [Lachnospiraceae bacterium]
MFEEIIEAIQEHGRIIIHRHSSPDGDALGSQIGLAELIRATYPDKTVYTVGDAAGRYAFMDGAVMDEIPDKAYEGALAVILDSAEASLVSDKRYALAAKTVRIDHHIKCDTFADLEVVDTSFESCAGMIAYLAKEQDLNVNEQAATAMYTGMVTDSGRFRYDATTARTFELAAFLLSHGAKTQEIYRNLYAEDLSRLQLRAKFIDRIQFFEDSPVAYIYTSREDMEALGNPDVFSVSRGMVNVMADIKGIDIWANFTEDENEVLCELRSSCYNIQPVAVKYNGGGHKKACGAGVKDRAEAMEMLKDLKAIAERGEKE